MSKRMGAKLTCTACRTEFTVELYRTLWVEYEENMAMVMEDRVNLFECPGCKRQAQPPFAFMATNAAKSYAVWYEPYPDPMIDTDVAEYVKMLGLNNYFVEAPRIADWEEFKETVRRYDGGELRGTPVDSAMIVKGLRVASQIAAERRGEKRTAEGGGVGGFFRRLFGKSA